MNCALFDGLENNLDIILKKLSAKRIVAKKNDIILSSGNIVENIYICLQGTFVVELLELDGNANIISTLDKGGHFGCAFAVDKSVSPVELEALTDGEIMLIPYAKILELDDENSKMILMGNLLKIVSKKSVQLITKIQHLSARSIRGKITCYLSTMEKRFGKREFNIPFDRQGLADYLCVDRVALSKELSKMKAEGIIDYNKNHFVLKY